MQPLAPLAPPTSLSFLLPTTVSGSALLSWALGAVILYWLIYTLVGTFHWVRYSHSPAVATPAIAVHIIVSLICIGYAVTSLLIL